MFLFLTLGALDLGLTTSFLLRKLGALDLGFTVAFLFLVVRFDLSIGFLVVTMPLFTRRVLSEFLE